MTAQIGFATTCKGRLNHLKQTLPINLGGNPNAKFIVLSYGHDPELVDWVRGELGGYIHHGRLVVYTYPTATSFRIAHAKNMAHRCAILEGCNVLVNLDADNFAGTRFDEYLVNQLFEGVFLWAAMIKGVLPRGISGRIVVTDRAFLKAGGYDEKFSTWASDDKDFNQRLRTLGYIGVTIDPQYLNAISHNNKLRFKECPEAVNEENYGNIAADTIDNKTRTSVANGGNFGCGTVYRNFEWSEPIALKRLPTRVFGIGMQKTATTSLHHAMEILGFESAHWVSAHWAKAIWREMNELKFSPTLERSYHVCDLPIPLLFRQLDYAYPGSKFILTMRRNEDEWLQSVEKHWDPAFNQFRAGWDDDSFSNRVHKLCYGRTDFYAETFRMRYRRHNEEVKQYFTDRQNDFLVMRMTEGGAGWPELCKFLNVPIPPKDYPRAYASY